MIGEIVIYADAATEEFPALVLREHSADGLDLLVFTQTGDYRVWDARRGDGPGEWQYQPTHVTIPEEEDILIVVRYPGEAGSVLQEEMDAADTVIAIDPTGHERLKVSPAQRIKVFRTPRPSPMSYAESLSSCMGSQRMNAAGLTKQMLSEWFALAIEGVKP